MVLPDSQLHIGSDHPQSTDDREGHIYTDQLNFNCFLWPSLAGSDMSTYVYTSVQLNPFTICVEKNSAKFWRADPLAMVQPLHAAGHGLHSQV